MTSLESIKDLSKFILSALVSAGTARYSTFGKNPPIHASMRVFANREE